MTQGTPRVFRLYFAVIAFVTFFVVVGSLISMLKVGLKTYIITAADAPSTLSDCSLSVATKSDSVEIVTQKCEATNAKAIQKYHQEKATAFNDALAAFIIMSPLFALHFVMFYREWKKSEKTA